jgi:ABC-type bacteriocin/lantibiotic exporter with double-glycine peptidase domain
MTEYSFKNQLKFVSKFIHPYKKYLVISLFLSIVSTCLGMVYPYFTKIIIDEVLLGGHSEWLLYVLLIIIVFVIFSFLLRVVNNYIYTLYSAKLLFDMRENLFSHIHKIPLIIFSQKKIGDVHARLSADMGNIQGFITNTLPECLFNVLTCIFTASILLYLNWKMALMCYAIVPGGFFILYKLRAKLIKVSRDLIEKNAEISHFLFESLSGVSTIRAFNAEDKEKYNLKTHHGKLLKTILREQVLGACIGSVPTLFRIINTIVIFGYGGYFAIQGKITIGTLVAFSSYTGRVFGPIKGLMDAYLAVQQSKVSLHRIKSIYDIKPAFYLSEGSVTKSKDELSGSFKMQNVCYGYDTNTNIIDDVSLSILPGKINAIIGQTGAGKTTLCHLMMRLFDPDSGIIKLDDIDIKEYKIRWLRQNISIVTQESFLFNTSIRENINISKPDATENEIVESAKTAYIHDFVKSLPYGYDTVVGDKGVRLSGGQKQRISIARAILLNPQVLIMDEATSSLDVSTEENLKEMLNQIMKNKTIIIVSHRLSTIRRSDHVIMLHEGKKIEEGHPEDISLFLQ